MPYIAVCKDKGGSAELRQSELAAHLEYIDTIRGQLLVAGPLSSAAGSRYDGSVFIYDVDSIDAAQKLLENDPYYLADIYASVEFAEFTPARGNWL